MKDKIKIDLYGDGIGFIELDQFMGDDVTIVNAARVSFGKKKDVLDDKDERLIKYLIRHRHTSTLEHNVVTFRMKVPLYVARQHMRHRTWSYNEISRRYTSIDMQFHKPIALRSQHKSNRQASDQDKTINPKVTIPYLVNDAGMAIQYAEALATDAISNHNNLSLKLFNNLIDAGVCREQARGILPQNMYTEYIGTVNLNNLLKFISLRTHDGAQKEIVDLANGMVEICRKIWPNIFRIYDELKDEKTNKK